MKTFLQKIEFDDKIISNLTNCDAVCEVVFKRLHELSRIYEQRNIDPQILIDTAKDIQKRLLKNLESTHKLTFFVKDMKWVNLILDFKLFKLGSLRFQYFPMDYTEIERSDFDQMELDSKTKEIFYTGKPLINIHIEANTNFTTSAIDSALSKARQFFKKEFPDIKFDGFVTRSWLIHPGTTALLDKTTNIYHFAKRFDVIATNNATYQVLQRVYQTDDLNQIQELKKKTTLQRRVYKNLDSLGIAFGFMKFY